nr:MAG TPA_asm: hypothetical protein [Caudoviricetes sp.]
MSKISRRRKLHRTAGISCKMSAVFLFAELW